MGRQPHVAAEHDDVAVDPPGDGHRPLEGGDVGERLAGDVEIAADGHELAVGDAPLGEHQRRRGGALSGCRHRRRGEQEGGEGGEQGG